jgi:RHS repeat-associated protein
MKTILTAIAVALSAFVQPALANYTYDKNGEPTHYKGIPLPPIQTVEEARAATDKRIAAIKAEEAKQAAEGAVSSNRQSEIGNHQLFFTGKPYLEETGQYLFLFRHYDPELARWTTADPSGFPDGANNSMYSRTPTTEFDALGLFLSGTHYTTSKYGAGSSVYDMGIWTLGKSGAGSFVGISTLGTKAMSVADGSAGVTNWALSASEIALAKSQTAAATYNNKSNTSDPYNGTLFADYVQNKILDSFHGVQSGGGSFALSFNVLYPHQSDGYWAFGNAMISITGQYNIQNYNFGWLSTVGLSDVFTFAPYSALASSATSATGAGYRLQDSGFIQAFNTSASWNRTWTAFLE